MEAAASLVRRGLDVTVVGPESTPFEQVLGLGGRPRRPGPPRTARYALRPGQGSDTAASATAEVRAVELDDGTSLEADVVVVGIGVRPSTEFVRGVELDPDGGLPVDGSLRVAPGVWAAGDVARYPEPHTGRDVRIEHWRLAEQHGRAAAADIAGREGAFAGVPFFWTQHFDLELGYAGAGQGWQDVIIAGDPAAADFTAFYADGDRLLAACGTQRDEIGAFVELMRADALPTAGELHGRAKAALPQLLASLGAGASGEQPNR